MSIDEGNSLYHFNKILKLVFSVNIKARKEVNWNLFIGYLFPLWKRNNRGLIKIGNQPSDLLLHEYS